MGRVGNRLKKLEEAYSSAGAHTKEDDALEAYFRALENFQREKEGLEPLPYSEEDRVQDELFLIEVIPVLRASIGWQSQESQQLLDEWEQEIHKRLSKGVD